MPNEFKRPDHYDHEIVNDQGKVGEIRVKPNAIPWAPKGSHKWYGVKLEEFADFMVNHGKEQSK